MVGPELCNEINGLRGGLTIPLRGDMIGLRPIEWGRRSLTWSALLGA